MRYQASLGILSKSGTTSVLNSTRRFISHRIVISIKLLEARIAAIVLLY
jgi:hypothetical protein